MPSWWCVWCVCVCARAAALRGCLQWRAQPLSPTPVAPPSPPSPLSQNAIQSASFCIVQNSLEEGFGLTVLEAMYKRIPVIGTAQALGISSQITDGVTGLLTHGDPSNAQSVARSLATMLGSTKYSSTLATNGQARAMCVVQQRSAAPPPGPPPPTPPSPPQHPPPRARTRCSEHGLMYGQAEKWLSLVLDLKSRATA